LGRSIWRLVSLVLVHPKGILVSEKIAVTPTAAARVPAPAHPHERREPLPWRRPKPSEDDPDAPARVRAILESPSYRQADRDVDFLNCDDARGLRLQLDYRKAEHVLEQEGIAHTIVVFGSTRIREPLSARRDVARLRAASDAAPGDAALRRRLAVAERIEAKSSYYEIAREFSRLVSTVWPAQRRERVLVMTGGGPGIMEAANRGAHDAGAKSIGLNITLPQEQYPNPYVTPGLCFRFHYFAIRKLHLLMRARALVAFPGGYGTLDELFELLTLVQTRKMHPLPIILVGESYWRQVFNPEFLVDEGVIDAEDRELFWFAETAEEIWNDILHWHDLTGGPLGKSRQQPA
jgi:uncharacterized protein (TIGR00730 family)